jgi:hypothetical protein
MSDLNMKLKDNDHISLRFNEGANSENGAFRSVDSVKTPVLFDHDHPQWTLLDQSRLDSLNRLHSRSREYHNNIHTFSSTSETKTSFNVSPEVACRYYLCDTSREANGKVLTAVNYDRFDSKMSKLMTPTNGFLWIHIDDLSCLDRLFHKFQIHQLYHPYFTDLRVHSVFIESETGFFVSYCSCYFENYDIAKMKKVFIYVSSNLCLTFEHDVLPDLKAGTSIASEPNKIQPISIIGNIEKTLTQDTYVSFFLYKDDSFYRIIELKLIFRAMLV